MSGRRGQTCPRRPAKKYSQGERLLSLYDMLHQGQRLNAGRAAETLEVSRRTIERDLRYLHDVLALEEVEEEHGLSYQLPHAGRQWRITPWQVLAISVGARLTGFLSGQRFATEVEPLLDQFRRSLNPGDQLRLMRLERKIHVVATGHKDYRGSPALQDRLGCMLDGLLIEKPITLGYLSHHRRRAGETPGTMQVQPLCLTLHRGAVYFVVDVLEGGGRLTGKRIMLALDRITEARVETGAEQIEYPTDFEPVAYFEDAFGVMARGGLQEVRLRVSSEMAPYVLERYWHATQHLVTGDDGALLVTLTLRGLEEVAEWILTMADQAQALEPPELVELVKRRLERALAQYA